MHKFSVTRKSLLFIFVFIVCASELFVSAEKFTVSKDKPKAKAVVSSKNFKVTVNPGSVDDYDPSKKFELIVGGCNLKVTTNIVGPKGQQVQFAVTDPSGTSTNSNGPKSFAVSKDGIDFTPKDPEKLLCTKAGAIKFGDYPGDKSKFLITVELKDPSKLPLVLSSEDELYDPGLKAWQIAAIIVGVIILLLIVLSVVGGIVFCVRKRKKQLQEQGTLKTKVKTGDSTEDKVISNSKPMQEPKKVEKRKKLSKNVSEKREDKLVSEAQMPKVSKMNEDSRKQDVSQSQKVGI